MKGTVLPALRVSLFVCVVSARICPAGSVGSLGGAGGEGGIAVDPNSGASLAGWPESSPCDVIVKFHPNTPAQVKADVLRENGCSLLRSCAFADLHLARIPLDQSPPETIERLQACGEVAYAEANCYAYCTFVPNDPLYALQWNLYNPVNGGIRIQDAWDVEQGDPNVIVAVLDTGVAYEDFEAFRLAPDLARASFVSGYDFVNDDNHPNDDQGHGTHVAGTIAQNTNNGLGVAGVAFGCSIMPVKVMDSRGAGDHFTIAEGIHFAVEQGAMVLNMSFGASRTSRTLQEAIAWASQHGVTIVCAAGNDFRNGNPRIYPAAYDEYCIAVGATRFDLGRAPYSSSGSYVDVVAPGGDTQVDQNGDGYADGIVQQTFSGEPGNFAYWFLQGTSMATPHVSGLAALLASRGVVRPDKIRQAIEKTARDLGPSGWDPQYGWGLIDASAALNYRVRGDFTGDNVVSYDDLAVFGALWLRGEDRSENRFASDLNGDGLTNFVDFALLGTSWDR